jgi:hypothetical protein
LHTMLFSEGDVPPYSMYDTNGVHFQSDHDTTGDLKPNEIASIFQHHSTILMNRIHDGDEIIAVRPCGAMSPEDLTFEVGDRAIVLDRPSFFVWHVQRARDGVTAFVDPEYFVSHVIVDRHDYRALIEAAFCAETAYTGSCEIFT